MDAADLERVLEIAESVHPDYPEDLAVFANRLVLFPAGCMCLEHDDRVVGYLISHPAVLNDPPELNTVLPALPASADCYYIHDLALLAQTRGSGSGGQGALLAAEVAMSYGFDRIGLVAVNNSTAFWNACGFISMDSPKADAKLASYGDGSSLMVRHLSARQECSSILSV